MSTYMGRLLRVNLSTGESKVEPIPGWIQRHFLGPRGFAAWYIFRELPPGVHPLSPENKLVIGAPVLGGTSGQGFSKWLVATKSPLTGGYARSICGGNFGAFLKFAGFHLLIIEGQAKRPCYVTIENSEVRINNAGELWGLDTCLLYTSPSPRD